MAGKEMCLTVVFKNSTVQQSAEVADVGLGDLTAHNPE
jgi:hypothetical protein